MTTPPLPPQNSRQRSAVAAHYSSLSPAFRGVLSFLIPLLLCVDGVSANSPRQASYQSSASRLRPWGYLNPSSSIAVSSWQRPQQRVDAALGRYQQRHPHFRSSTFESLQQRSLPAAAKNAAASNNAPPDQIGGPSITGLSALAEAEISDDFESYNYELSGRRHSYASSITTKSSGRSSLSPPALLTSSLASRSDSFGHESTLEAGDSRWGSVAGAGSVGSQRAASRSSWWFDSPGDIASAPVQAREFPRTSYTKPGRPADNGAASAPGFNNHHNSNNKFGGKNQISAIITMSGGSSVEGLSRPAASAVDPTVIGSTSDLSRSRHKDQKKKKKTTSTSSSAFNGTLWTDIEPVRGDLSPFPESYYSLLSQYRDPSAVDSTLDSGLLSSDNGQSGGTWLTGTESSLTGSNAAAVDELQSPEDSSTNQDLKLSFLTSGYTSPGSAYDPDEINELEGPNASPVYINNRLDGELLKVLNLNLWGLGWPFGSDKELRFRAVREELLTGKYDLVLLQELWYRDDYDLLRTTMPYATEYNSINGGCSSFLIPLGCSGLTVLSKYPIVNVRLIPFNHKGDFWRFDGEIFVHKGVGIARILYHNKTIDVFTTHLVSYTKESDDNKLVRYLQTEETVRLISQSDADIRIFGGDINAPPIDGVTQPYGMLRSILKDALLEKFPSSSFHPVFATYGNSENTYTHHSKPERIDYLMFGSKDAVKMSVLQFTMPVMMTRGEDGRIISVSDHEALSVTFLIQDVHAGPKVEAGNVTEELGSSATKPHSVATSSHLSETGSRYAVGSTVTSGSVVSGAAVAVSLKKNKNGGTNSYTSDKRIPPIINEPRSFPRFENAPDRSGLLYTTYS